MKQLIPHQWHQQLTNDTVTFDRTEINPTPFREGETKTSYNEETDVHTVEHTIYLNVSPDMYRHAYEIGAKYWIFSEQTIEKNLSHFMDSSFDKVYGNNFWFYDSEESFNADVGQGTKAKAEFTADRIEEDIFSTQTLWGNQDKYLTAGIDYTGQGNGNAYMSLTRRCSARMNRYWVWYANQGGTEHYGGGNGTYESASGDKTLGSWTDGGKYGTISINGQIKAVYGGTGWNGTTIYHSIASTSYNTGNVQTYTIYGTGDTGISSISGLGTYNAGSTANITYHVKSGYHLLKITEGSSTWTNLAGKEGAVADSWHMGSNRNFKVYTEPNKYYVDLNGIFDGQDGTALSHAKADIYINGSKVATGVTDYYTQHPFGAKYKFVVTPDSGYSVDKTIWEGTIGTGKVSIYPRITTNSYTLSVNPNGGTYKGSSSTTSTSVKYGTKQEVNEIPTRSGYTFLGWSRSGSGSLHSANASSKSNEIVQTEKADSDGTAVTNYSLSLANTTSNFLYPHVSFFYYPYESGHTYRITYDLKVNSVSDLYYAQIRHSAFTNNWEATADNINQTTSGWSHRTMERTFTGTTVTQNGTASAINPMVEFYCGIQAGKTGKINFDIKNLTVYDVTANKYVSSKTETVKNGATVDIGAGDTTLTAHWSANTYKVTYDINAGSHTTGTMDPDTVTYGSAYKTKKNGLTEIAG